MAEPKKEVSPKSTAIGCLVLFVVLVLAGWACSSILKDQPAPKTTTSGGLSIIWKESTPVERTRYCDGWRVDPSGTLDTLAKGFAAGGSGTMDRQAAREYLHSVCP